MNNKEEPNQINDSIRQIDPQEKDVIESVSETIQLSLEQRQKLQKLLMFGALGIIFSLSIWFIFKPSAADKKKVEEQIGLNNDVPQATNFELPDDKMKAYSLATDEEKENNRQGMLGSLYDYFDRESEKQNESSLYEDVYEEDPVSKSVSQYQETTRMLESFNEPSEYDYEKEEMQYEIDYLRSKLEEAEDYRNKEVDQIELMEKSYQLAAKYLPQSTGNVVNPFETAVERKMDDPMTNAYKTAEPKESTLTVLPDIRDVVSSLYQDVPDSVFIQEHYQERNHGFISANQSIDDGIVKNTLKVSIHETSTITDGEEIRLRLLETARVSNMIIPKNKILTAIAKVQGNRLTLLVTNIEQHERIINVNLSAYDLDGQLGVFIPNADEMDAVKEVVAGIGQSAGTSFTFASSAGQQLASDAGRGIMQGASQYLSKKMREVKVTLKSGHLLYLIANK